jgi:hypothetical protein
MTVLRHTALAFGFARVGAIPVTHPIHQRETRTPDPAPGTGHPAPGTGVGTRHRPMA